MISFKGFICCHSHCTSINVPAEHDFWCFLVFTFGGLRRSTNLMIHFICPHDHKFLLFVRGFSGCVFEILLHGKFVRFVSFIIDWDFIGWVNVKFNLAIYGCFHETTLIFHLCFQTWNNLSFLIWVPTTRILLYNISITPNNPTPRLQRHSKNVIMTQTMNHINHYNNSYLQDVAIQE